MPLKALVSGVGIQARLRRAICRLTDFIST
jgi:hypothetical protein